MLMLEGRAVGLSSETFPKKDGTQGVRHELSVATGEEVLVVDIPVSVFTGLNGDLELLRTFGTHVQIKCTPRLGFSFGKPIAGLSAQAIRCQAQDGAPGPSAPPGVDHATGELVTQDQ